MMIDCFAHSLHHRSNLAPASKGCEAALRSLFWTLNSLNLLLEMQCEFPFNLMGQTNDNFFCCCYKANHSAYSTPSMYTGRFPDQRTITRGLGCVPFGESKNGF